MGYRSFLLIILIYVVTSISAYGIDDNLNQSILLFKDKDGVYLYDHQTQREKLIFKAKKRIFLDEPYYLVNDTLTFGFKGEIILTEIGENSRRRNYYKEYYSIDLTSGNYWISKKTLYEIENSILKVKTFKLTPDGEAVLVNETTSVYKRGSSSYKGFTFNNLKPRFYSEHCVGSKTVFSLCGSIYLVDKSDTTLLVDFKGKFDPKFGSGYYQPQIDPKGEFVVFRYLPGIINLEEEPSLQKIDLITKRIEIVKNGRFVKPMFSENGNYLLYKRDERKGKKHTWISSINLLNLRTLEEKQIGKAYSAGWKN